MNPLNLFVLVFFVFLSVGAANSRSAPESCFLLYDAQNGRTVREPSAACSTRATPASTFKIPHALAALDAGVISGPHEVMRYDGSPRTFERWRRDHDLASAMRDSVVWYFQRIAERLRADPSSADLGELLCARGTGLAEASRLCWTPIGPRA